jgi:hypothetical protein
MSSTAEISATGVPTVAFSTGSFVPCVQYGFPKGSKEAVREPKLRTIFDQPPAGVETAGPICLLTPSQFKWQQRLPEGYEVSGASSIATELQNQCEDADRVLYPVYVESDVYGEEGPETLIEWFRKFVEECLDLMFEDCTLYYSGSRSIHVHLPRFITSGSELELLRNLAKIFCEETEAELDVGIYSKKRLFRLPGVRHVKTGLAKVEIGPEWSHEQIVREGSQSVKPAPESFEVILREVFTPGRATPYTIEDVQTLLDNDEFVLRLSPEPACPVPLIEAESPPADPEDLPEWERYNAKEFSPYALAAGGRRSVASVRVVGGAFARRSVRKGATLIPVFFHGAKGCDGDFVKDNQHGPLQLSQTDYSKWEGHEYSPGDHVLLIGGQSRNSRMFRVDERTATMVGRLLMNTGGRRAALDYLAGEGYEVGSSGSATVSTRPRQSSESAGSSGKRAPRPTSIPPVKNPTTRAARLQQRAERDGIETLSHRERISVANRLLQVYGWDLTWEWFREQFGPEFKPDVTYKHLKSVVKKYPDLAHIQVPPRPY